MSDIQLLPVKYLLDAEKITTVQDIVEIMQSFGINYNDEIEGTTMQKFMIINPEWSDYQKAKEIYR